MVKEVKNSVTISELSHIRDEKTNVRDFREGVERLATYLCYELLKDSSTNDVEIKTPICNMKTKTIDESKYVFLPILRAGTGMIEGIKRVVPNAVFAHIGMQRDEKTLKPCRYYYKAPKNIAEKEVVILDPMLATGGSGADAIEEVKKAGVKNIKFLCIIAAPEGLKYLESKHPDVDIYCASIDEKLNEVGYIVPGLGDAGDRIFGTL